MGTEEFNRNEEFQIESQHSQDEAAIQRIANNQIQKSQLSVLKFIAGIVATAALALIPVIVSDHYTLVEVNKMVVIIAKNQEINSLHITELQQRMPSIKSRWSLGMQMDFSKQIGSQNKNFIVPNIRDIQESHLDDLGN